MLVVVQAMTNMEAINMLGVRQVNRNCIALQQVCLTIDHLTLAAQNAYGLGTTAQCSFGALHLLDFGTA
jgi:hypothetical protein